MYQRQCDLRGTAGACAGAALAVCMIRVLIHRLRCSSRPTWASGSDSEPPPAESPPAAAATADGNPQIKILSPTLDKPLSAPIDIDVQFVPAGSVAIRPDTFRVCYVAFITMDITMPSTETRQLLGWQPLHPGLLADLDQGHYFTTT